MFLGEAICQSTTAEEIIRTKETCRTVTTIISKKNILLQLLKNELLTSREK